jgi:hypothetical protein
MPDEYVEIKTAIKSDAEMEKCKCAHPSWLHYNYRERICSMAGCRCQGFVKVEG